MLFMAFMLVSNWMGSPEFRVQSSPDREVSIQLLPEEGPGGLKGIPFEHLTPGTYAPGQVVEGNPFLTRGLEAFQEAMYQQSCTLTGNEQWPECRVETLENGTRRFSNFFTTDAMPDPVARLVITEVQPNLKEYVLHYEVTNPDTGETSNTEWIRPRHAFSNYEEECRFLNKSCATD